MNVVPLRMSTILFAAKHVEGSQSMERKENMHQMVKVIAVLSSTSSKSFLDYYEINVKIALPLP